MKEHSYLDPNELKGLNLSVAAVERYAVTSGWEPVETPDLHSQTFSRLDGANKPITFLLPARAENIDEPELHITVARAISAIAAIENKAPQETLAAIQSAIAANPRQTGSTPSGEKASSMPSNPLSLTRARAALLAQPIFLVGAERSGTTLLRLMLDHHPQICWCSEFEYSVEAISPSGRFPELKSYYRWLATNRVFRSTNFTIDRTRDYPELVDDFLRQRQDLHQKPIVGATVHRHFDRLLYVWPDAKFIKILRDGRDVARSCMSMKWAGNIWRGADRWIRAENLWAKMSRSLPQERYIELRYEDLITQPEATLARICEFVGTTYSPTMLTYPEDSTYFAPNQDLIFQ
ncbi:MAG: sulfotransferase, partial [Cyanobacteria bacterium J06641_5]